MTTAQQDADTAPPRDLSSAEKQQAALRYARQYVARNGKRGAGAAVAREFDMSPRWGQDIAAAVTESAAAPASAVPIGRTGSADRQTVADAVAARSGSAAPARAVFGTAGSAPRSAVAPARPSAPPAAPPAQTGTPIGSGSARPVDESAVRRPRPEAADRQPIGTQSAVPEAAESAAAGRAFALLGFGLGTLASIIANILHAWIPPATPEGFDPIKWAAEWVPTVPAQATGALFPLTLMVVVEVISRIPWPEGVGWVAARYVGGMVVALGAAVISYGHLHGLLVAYNYDWLGAAVGPLVIDGLMVVSGFGLLAVGRRHRSKS